jgi:hypothetical protein
MRVDGNMAPASADAVRDVLCCNGLSDVRRAHRVCLPPATSFTAPCNPFQRQMRQSYPKQRQPAYQDGQRQRGKVHRSLPKRDRQSARRKPYRKRKERHERQRNQAARSPRPQSEPANPDRQRHPQHVGNGAGHRRGMQQPSNTCASQCHRRQHEGRLDPSIQIPVDLTASQGYTKHHGQRSRAGLGIHSPYAEQAGKRRQHDGKGVNSGFGEIWHGGH